MRPAAHLIAGLGFLLAMFVESCAGALAGYYGQWDLMLVAIGLFLVTVGGYSRWLHPGQPS